MPSEQFLFAGFLPARVNARRAKLEELISIPATLVFYEAPHRIAATLEDALEVLGNRRATVARELTKIHEEIVRGSLKELAQRFGADSPALRRSRSTSLLADRESSNSLVSIHALRAPSEG